MDGMFAHAGGYQYESSNTYPHQPALVKKPGSPAIPFNFSTSVGEQPARIGIPKGSIYRENNNNFYSHAHCGQLKFDRRLEPSPSHYLTAIAVRRSRNWATKHPRKQNTDTIRKACRFARVSYTTQYTDVLGATKADPR